MSVISDLFRFAVEDVVDLLFTSTIIPPEIRQIDMLSFNAELPSYRRMPNRTPDARAEQKLTGTAIKLLRTQTDKRLIDIGEVVGMTAQAWQMYEAGQRRFNPDMIEKVLSALGANEDDLAAAKAKVSGRPAPSRVDVNQNPSGRLIFNVYGSARAGVEGAGPYDGGEPVRSIDLRQILGRSTDAFEISDDTMFPWAAPGEIVLFDRDRYPKRGAGCLVETKAGDYFVRLYEKSDGSSVFLRQLFPEERTTPFPSKDIKGVYAILLRGD